MKVLGSIVVVAVVAIGISAIGAYAEPIIPEGAKQLNGAEIKVFLEGKTFRLVVYDAAKSLTGTSTWELNNGSVHGEYSWDNQSPKPWSADWYVESNMNCIKKKSGEVECHQIYLDGEKFIEVRQDGVIHAVSTPID